ncbi:hypothetical protein [Clostridium bornimense]
MFDSAINHTYINKEDTMVTFIIINFYPT